MKRMNLKLIFCIYSIAYSTSIFSQTLSTAIIDVKPFGFKDQKEKQGIHFDFLTLILNKSNIKHNILVLPYPRVLKGIESGKIELSLFFRQINNLKVKELCKSIGFANYIISRKDFKIASINELIHKKVGIIRDAKYEDSFDSNNKIIKIPLGSYKQGIQLLKIKRIDALVLSAPAYLHLAKTEDLNFINTPIKMNTKYNYLYGNKNISNEVATKVCKANNELLKENIIYDILKKYQ